MPAVEEPPADLAEPTNQERPKARKAPPFTAQTARENQAKAVASRLARKRLREQGIDPDRPKATPADTANLPASSNEDLELVQEQITQARKLLNDTEWRYCKDCRRGGIEPQHRAQLMKALDALIERKRKILGISDPGTLRPKEQPAKRSLFGPPAAATSIPQAPKRKEQE